nr:MAG TPA: hypothetical protein [Caudoviricetes sp.]DAN46172.1 MAG TPA: hypothetical protein [Caudoviricetes sp.]
MLRYNVKEGSRGYLPTVLISYLRKKSVYSNFIDLISSVI